MTPLHLAFLSRGPLIGNVDEFWIQLDLTNEVPLELNQLDDVRLRMVPMPAAAWLFASALLVGVT